MFEDGSIFNQLLVERLNYFIYVVLLLIGLWAMIAKNNLIKKLIGMSIFQTAIILFYVSIGVKEGATIPIYLPEHDPHGSHAQVDSNYTELLSHGPKVLEASAVPNYTNPLPHVLMLTAIVVGVATLGLALSVCLRIYRGYGTVEEDELLEKLEREDSRRVGGSNKRRPRRRAPANKEVTAGQSKRGPMTEEKKSDKLTTRRRHASKSRAKTNGPAKEQAKSSNEENDMSKPVKRRRPARKPKEDKS
ncbi:cation:proton antiporter subunit C [Opitutales bacterium]|nr:cation:proton antiporter subunit C [Opitutales bacterium]